MKTKEQKIPETIPEFNLIKILNQKRKDEKITYEGAIIAFKLPDGNTGTWTLCQDTGVRLRLLQECKIQEKIIEVTVDDLARKTFLASMSRGAKGGASYLG